ncbi:MAG: polysaccharide biosynthesis C-terminal domain-containing protein, partial [Balneolales bacterium]|nr:polysaccharide biosynthesis C-terminal domain-containing protein [Balneolales bacterium]
GFFLTAEDAGLYGAAFKMIAIVMMIDRLLVNLLIPNLSHQWSSNKSLAIDNLKKANKLMLASGAILALGLAIGASDFAVWIFGEEYVDSIPILIILCGMVFLTFQNSIFSYGLMAIGEDKAFLKSTAVSGTISLILIICASKFTNLKGVAYAVVISELLITLISYLWFSRFVKLGAVFNSITTILVSMLIFWLSFSLPLASWLESLLLSALLFIILYLVKVIRNEEILWLRNKFTA